MQNPFFVYGTLRQGASNQHYVNGHIAERKPATLRGLTMLHLGSYPMCIQGHHLIHGEVLWIKSESYELVCKRLDTLEDHPHWYRREVRDVSLRESQSTVKAWVYIGVNPEKYRHHPVIEHGNWLASDHDRVFRRP